MRTHENVAFLFSIWFVVDIIIGAYFPAMLRLFENVTLRTTYVHMEYGKAFVCFSFIFQRTVGNQEMALAEKKTKQTKTAHMSI